MTKKAKGATYLFRELAQKARRHANSWTAYQERAGLDPQLAYAASALAHLCVVRAFILDQMADFDKPGNPTPAIDEDAGPTAR